MESCHGVPQESTVEGNAPRIYPHGNYGGGGDHPGPRQFGRSVPLWPVQGFPKIRSQNSDQDFGLDSGTIYPGSQRDSSSESRRPPSKRLQWLWAVFEKPGSNYGSLGEAVQLLPGGPK